MEEQKTTNVLDEMANEIQKEKSENSSLDTKTNTDLPAAVVNQKMAMQSAKDTVLKQRQERIAYSKNSTIVGVILPKESAAKLLKDGVSTVGHVKDPAKTLETFLTKTGGVVGEKGEVSFSNIPQGEITKAKEMYDKLVACVNNPSTPFSIYINDKLPSSFKGMQVVESSGGVVNTMKMSDAITLFMDKTAGTLDTTVRNSQAQLAKSRNSKDKIGEKGTGTTKSAKKTNEYQGVASIRFSNKDEMIKQLTKYHKEKTDKISVQAGVRGTDAVKYYRETLNKKTGKKNIGTYRIPLEAEQYELKVNDPEFLKVFGEGKGIAGQQTKYKDMNDDEAVNEMLQQVEDVLAIVVISGVGNSNTVKTINSDASAADAAAAKKLADEMNQEGL